MIIIDVYKIINWEKCEKELQKSEKNSCNMILDGVIYYLERGIAL